MANKDPLKGPPSERKARQFEKARRKAEGQAREKAERRGSPRPGAGPEDSGQGTVPPSGTK